MRPVVVVVVVVVVVFLVALCSADLLPISVPGVETIQIHNDHVINVYLGNPGKWLRLRVRGDANDIYLFQHPSPYSQSWRTLPTSDPYGQPRIRDTLVIGSTQLRADIIVGRFPDETSTTVEGTQAEGVLGIGALSPLWVVWRNFTKSRDQLILGEAAHSASTINTAATTLPEALVIQLPPALLYGLGATPTFVSELRAVLTESSRRSLEHDCLQSLGSIVDDTAELAGADEMLIRVLGITPNEQLCSVQREYRVLLAPNSDYNVVPRALMMHRMDSPPIFHLSSDLDNETSLVAVLFNRFDDAYIELDTTNAAGSGVRRQANRVRPGSNNTIVLGEYGLRRFTLGYELDAERVFLALKHNGLSRTGASRTVDHSIEVRRIQDIFVLVAGLLLWALLATEPDPVYPRHAKQDDEHYAHARHTSIASASGSKRAPTVVPEMPRHRPSPQTLPTIRRDVEADADDDDGYVVAIRSRIGATTTTNNNGSGDTEKNHASGTNASSSASQQAVGSPQNGDADHLGLQQHQQLDDLAVDTAVRMGAVLAATFRMESEWPVPPEALLYVQALSEAIVAIYFALAMAFYDTTWALAMVLVKTPATDALGWTTLAFAITAVVALSLVAALSAGRDARIGSFALQAQVLVAIYVLLVALFQWDLALGLLFVVAGQITVVLVAGTMSAWGLVPQYHRHASQVRQQMRAPLAMVTLAWLLYVSLALFPFVVNRLWDSSDQQSVVISVFLVLGVAFPIALYMAFAPFVYPVLTANAACARIFEAAQRRHSAITGAP